MGWRNCAARGLWTVLIGGALAAAPATATGPSAAWRSDFAAAESEAKRLDRPLLLHFHASWCGPCRRMESEVLNSLELREYLAQRVVGVKIDIDEHPELGRRFSVKALPHDTLVSPQGRILSHTEGYQKADRYVANLARGESRYSASKKVRIAKSTQPAPKPAGAEITAPRPVRRHQTAESQRTEREIASAGDSPAPAVRLQGPEPAVGLDGYCPVTLWKTRQWKRGKSDFACDFQGLTYHLQSAVELDEFKAHPARYAPQLLGCDPVALWETERAIPGSTRSSAYYDGELYMFENTESRTRFRSDPPRYTRTRHVLKVEKIERTRRG